MTTQPGRPDNVVLQDLLRSVWNQARRPPTADEEILAAFRRVTEDFGFSEDHDGIEQRGIGPYSSVPENLVLNGDFETDLASWTESLAGTVTATTARDITQSQWLWGSLASCKIALTASTGAGDARRTQVVAVTAGLVYSAEVLAYVVALTNAQARLRLQFRGGGGGVLATHTVSWAAVTSGFELGQLQNLTAPVGAVDVLVELVLAATAAGASATTYFDLVRIEQGAAVSVRSSRAIAGEFTAS